MKTTIKSLRAEKYAGELTGKLVITIDGSIKGVQRNVDDDGVITFAIADGNVMRMAWSALSAQVRNAVDGELALAVNYRLDAAKADDTEKRVALLNTILSNAEIEVEATEIDIDQTDDVEAHKAVSYNISKVKLTKIAKLVVCQYFVANTMAVTGVADQLSMAKMLFGIEA